MALKRAILACTLATLTIGCGASTPAPPPTIAAGQPAQQPDAQLVRGYSLLYELVSKQRQVDGLLMIKSPSKPTAQLVRDIAETTGRATRMLERWAEDTPGLALDRAGLPAIERAARDRNEAAIRQQILFSSGDKLERYLLLSQAKAAQYGQALAASLVNAEPDAQRRDALQQLADDYAALYRRTVDRLIVVQ